MRIHAAEAGAPVLRDHVYGEGVDELSRKLYLKRMALHAHRLALDHPITGEHCAWEVPPPRDLKKAWNRARKLFSEVG